jgi:hypothetical protein
LEEPVDWQPATEARAIKEAATNEAWAYFIERILLCGARETGGSISGDWPPTSAQSIRIARAVESRVNSPHPHRFHQCNLAEAKKHIARRLNAAGDASCC